MRGKIRCTFASAVALAILAWTASIADAQARSTFDLPPQPLADSLRAVGSQTNVNVLFDPPLVAEHQAPALKGEFTTDQAFTLLLHGTGIKHDYMNDRTIVLASAQPTPPRGAERDVPAEQESEGASDSPSRRSGEGANPQSGKGEVSNEASRFWGRFRLAQADTDVRSESSSVSTDTQSSDRNSASPVIDEVIVTAQKRTEKLQQVPISITALSGEALDQYRLDGTTEALSRVPGVGVPVAALGAPTIMIRGVQGAGATNFGSSPNAFYLDTVPFGMVRNTFVPQADIYDLERIEVLRGPQGTLYGASALNGVVRILTRDANLDQWEFKARGLYSGTEDGEDSYRGDATVNVPIVEGKLAARAVVGYQNQGGWIDKPNDEDANVGKVQNYRLKLKAQPNDGLSIGASAWSSRSDYGAQSIGRADRTNAVPFSEPLNANFDLYGLNVSYDFANYSITSSTGYLDYVNSSFLTLVAFNLNAANAVRYDAEVFTQEILLSETAEGPWRWTLGGMFRDAEDRRRRTPDRQPAYRPSAPFIQPAIDLEDLSESFALYGELTRSFLDGRIEVTAGLRYFEDTLDTKENISATGNPATPLVQQRGEFDAVSPRALITWRPTAETTFYASYSEGFRSGINQTPETLVTAPDFQPTGPDKLKNYEVGAKGSLFDRFLAYEVAVYYMDWIDVQRQLAISILNNNTGPFVAAFINGAGNKGPGVDFALTLYPAPGFELGGTVSHTELELADDLITRGTVVIGLEGEPAGPPQDTWSAWATWSFPLGSLTGRVASSFNYISGSVASRTVSGTNVIITRNPSFTMGRADISLSSDHWTSTLFVDNMTDEDPQGFTTTPDFSNRPRPRTIGVQFDYRF